MEVDYKKYLSDLIWEKFIDTKNGYSDYYEITGEGDELNRGDWYPKGIIIAHPEILSFTIPEHKRLRWSEFAIKIGITPERYVSDGHDCHKCPKEKDCEAYFKYESGISQLQCSGWKRDVDDSVYKKNLEEALNEQKDIKVL